MDLGSVKHSKKKIARAYHDGIAYDRTAKVEVHIHRSGTKYMARACVVRGAKGWRMAHGARQRCGLPELASTPTTATKKALRSLAQKLK